MTTSLYKALAQQSAMEAKSRRAGDGDAPDAVMLKRKPKANHLLWPDWDEVPEGALAPRGRKAPSVVPVARVEQRGKQRGKTRGLGVTVGVEVSF